MQHDTQPLHEVSDIETPEHIALRFCLAGVASRAYAYIIDFFVQFIPLVAALIALVAFSSDTVAGKSWVEKHPDGRATVSLFAQAVAALALFFMNFGYFVFFEIFWRGQTPGKRLIGIRVMRDGGYPIEPRAALIRNLLRIVDFLPGMYVLGMVTLFWGRAGKRLGDYAAGTLVIKEGRQDATAVEAPPLPASKKGLSAHEMQLIRDYLARAPQLSEESRERVATAIAERIAARMGLPKPPQPERFLEDMRNDAHA